MSTVTIPVVFELGDLVVAEVTFQNGMRKRKAFVYGIIVAIESNITMRDGKPANVTKYSVLDSHDELYSSVEVSNLQTMQFFIANQKHRLHQLAREKDVYIKPLEKEEVQ